MLYYAMLYYTILHSIVLSVLLLLFVYRFEKAGSVNMHRQYHHQQAAFATKRLPLELSGAKLPVKLPFRLTTGMRAKAAAEVDGGWREAGNFYRALRGSGVQSEGLWTKQQRSSSSFYHHYRCSALVANASAAALKEEM